MNCELGCERSPVNVNTNNPQLLLDSYPLSLLKLLRDMREIKKKSPFAYLCFRINSLGIRDVLYVMLYS